jgi:hypothetical protein
MRSVNDRISGILMLYSSIYCDCFNFFLSSVSIWVLLGLNDRAIDELESVWKDAVMACSRYYPGISQGGLRKTTNILSGYPVTRPRIELNTSRIQA